MKQIEVLLVEHTDDGRTVEPPRLLVNERLITAEPHPNGLLFLVPLDVLQVVVEKFKGDT